MSNGVRLINVGTSKYKKFDDIFQDIVHLILLFSFQVKYLQKLWIRPQPRRLLMHIKCNGCGRCGL